MFVYILESRLDGSQYVGMTDEPDERLKRHNAGFVRSTKSKRPWNRILLETFVNIEQARAREKYFKSGAGRRFRSRFKKSTGLPARPNIEPVSP